MSWEGCPRDEGMFSFALPLFVMSFFVELAALGSGFRSIRAFASYCSLAWLRDNAHVVPFLPYSLHFCKIFSPLSSPFLALPASPSAAPQIVPSPCPSFLILHAPGLHVLFSSAACPIQLLVASYSLSDCVFKHSVLFVAPPLHPRILLLPFLRLCAFLLALIFVALSFDYCAVALSSVPLFLLVCYICLAFKHNGQIAIL